MMHSRTLLLCTTGHDADFVTLCDASSCDTPGVQYGSFLVTVKAVCGFDRRVRHSVGGFMRERPLGFVPWWNSDKDGTLALSGVAHAMPSRMGRASYAKIFGQTSVRARIASTAAATRGRGPAANLCEKEVRRHGGTEDRIPAQVMYDHEVIDSSTRRSWTPYSVRWRLGPVPLPTEERVRRYSVAPPAPGDAASTLKCAQAAHRHHRPDPKGVRLAYAPRPADVNIEIKKL